MSILMIHIYGYYKRGSNKPDFKAFGPPNSVRNTVSTLMNDKDISVIVIENKINGHRFKWDHSADSKWRCISQPANSELQKVREQFYKSIEGSKAFKTPVITGSKAVLKINGQVVGVASPVEFKMEYSKK